MAYKTILTVLSAESQIPQLERAADLARQQDAHLEILCLGIDNSQPAYFFPGGTAYGLQEAIAMAMEDAEHLNARVTEALAGSVGLCWSSEALVAQSGGIAGLVGMKARFADLAVLASPYAEGQPAMPR